MPYLDFFFSPQAHKFRDGYNINHDTLMNGNPHITQSAPLPGKSLFFTSSPNNFPKNLTQPTEPPMQTKSTLELMQTL